MNKKYYVASILFFVTFILFFSVPTVLAESKNEDIKALYKGDNAFAHIEELCDLDPREAGTSAESEAATYIATEMVSYGLDVEIQEFDFDYFEELSAPELNQVSPNPTIYTPNDTNGFFTMLYSGSGDVTANAQLVSSYGCNASDFSGFTSGNIALIERGGVCEFSDKATNAADAGAVGVIIFNDSIRQYAFRGTLQGPVVSIPVVGSSYAIGQELAASSTTVRMFVDTYNDLRTSQNIIGTIEGLAPDQGIVYMGAHYDSVSAGPGANNNASGVAAMLEAVRVLSTRGKGTKATLKFIAFGANNPLIPVLDGSHYYVTENSDEVTTSGIGMINLDMIGVGDTCLIDSTGWAGYELMVYTQEKAEAWGLVWGTSATNTKSDHYNFEMAGCPAVFINQSPDPWNNTVEDTPDKIDVTTLEENGALATAVMLDWAKNPAHRDKKATASTLAIF